MERTSSLLEPDDDWGEGVDEVGVVVDDEGVQADEAPIAVPMVAVGPGIPAVDEEYDPVPVGAIAAAFGEGPASQKPRRAVVVGATTGERAADDIDDGQGKDGASHTNGTNGRNGSH